MMWISLDDKLVSSIEFTDSLPFTSACPTNSLDHGRLLYFLWDASFSSNSLIHSNHRAIINPDIARNRFPYMNKISKYWWYCHLKIISSFQAPHIHASLSNYCCPQCNCSMSIIEIQIWFGAIIGRENTGIEDKISL